MSEVKQSGEAILDDLKRRGLIHQTTDEEGIVAALNRGRVTAYVGVDPTANTIHLGHLLPILALRRLQLAGHRPIVVFGGATGMIGDPSGKSDERVLLDEETIEANCAAIRGQISRFLDLEGPNAAILTNNIDWIGKFSYIDWLREVGKHFTVNYMSAKESVRRRLEDRDQGISYTEFSYMLLQSFDFLELYRRHDCTLQIGGSDQWGNITAGIELIRRKVQGQGYGLTLPLVTTSTGQKFGKSEGNAVWLDAEQTSPYELYQYFMRADDRDIATYIRYFSFKTNDELDELIAAHEAEPHRRLAQRALAVELTELIHGKEALRRVELATEILFGREIEGLEDKELLAIFADVPSVALSKAILSEGVPLLDAFADAGLAKSKGEARRLIRSGGAYINNRRAEDENHTLTSADLASETVIVLRSGKKKYALLRFSE